MIVQIGTERIRALGTSGSKNNILLIKDGLKFFCCEICTKCIRISLDSTGVAAVTRKRRYYKVVRRRKKRGRRLLLLSSSLALAVPVMV